MIVKVGDTVGWSGSFGRDVVKPAIVEQMEVTEVPRDKHGVRVNQVDASLIEQNRVLFILDNGHWAYSDQFSLL